MTRGNSTAVGNLSILLFANAALPKIAPLQPGDQQVDDYAVASASLHNVNGSFFDFAAERFNGTETETLNGRGLRGRCPLPDLLLVSRNHELRTGQEGGTAPASDADYGR